jgi:hypothetical protein
MGWAAVQRIAKGVNAASDTVGSGDGWVKPTAGNLLVVSANSDATVTIGAVGGSTWSAGPSVVDGNGAYLWYKFSNGTETSITCTPSVSDTIVVTVCEYSGIAAFPFDAQNSSTIASSPGFATTSTSVTTAADGDLVIAVAAAHTGSGSSGPNPASPVWSNGFNNVLSGSTGGGNGVIDCYTFYAELTAGAPGSYSTSCTWTSGTVGDRQQLMIAFKAATGPQVVEVGTTAYATANTATITSASFTPGDGLLLVAQCGEGNGTGGASSLGAVTDSLGGTWTRLLGDNVSSGGVAEVWARDIVTGAAMTVTYDPGGTGASGLDLIVKQYASAKVTAAQPGATATNGGAAAYSKAIVTTTPGSLVVGSHGRATSGVVLTANASTTILGQFQGTAGDTVAAFRASALTTTPGSTTLGFTNTAAVANYIALVEILPSSAPESSSYVETYWPGGGMIGPPQVFQFMQDPRSDDVPPVVGGLSANLGIVAETDSAFTLSGAKAKASGQPSETDTAFPINRRKSTSVGQPSEVDNAFALARAKARGVGLATETDVAQPVGRSAHTKVIGQVTETDTAQPITRRHSRTLGLVTETDTAQPVGRLAHVKTLGLATETDSALHPGASRSKVIGQPSEVDTSFALTGRKSRTLGLIVETDTAQPMTATKGRFVVVGIASETDTAFALSRAKRRTIGLAVETDSAFADTRLHSHVLGLVSETDTALPFLLRRKTKPLGLASEVDSASPIARVKSRPIGLASESDTAFTLAGRRKARTLGQPVGLNISLPIGHGSVNVGLASETDTAFSLTRRKARAVGLVVETDAARPLASSRKVKAIGIVLEAATALPLGRLRSRIIGLVSEVGSALGLLRRKNVALGQPVETDTPQSVGTPSTTTKVRPPDAVLYTDRSHRTADIGLDTTTTDVGRASGTALLDRPLSSVDVGRP